MTSPHTLLIGYAGKNNFGDDMMIEAVGQNVDALYGPGGWAVVGGRTPLGKLIPLLQHAKRIVICGGHIINGRTGSYQRMLGLARLFRVPIVFFSIEASGWPAGRTGVLQRWIMTRAAISVRTAASKDLLQQHLPRASIEQVVDAFYLHDTFSELDVRNPCETPVTLGVFKFTAQVSRPGEIIVLPRTFPAQGSYTNQANITRILAEIDRLKVERPNLKIRLAPSAAVDDVAEIEQSLQAAGHKVLKQDAQTLLDLSAADHIVSNRLHIAKACVWFDLPNTLISYDLKTEAPELAGTQGRIVQLDGTHLDVATLTKPMALFASDVQRSRAVLYEGLSR